MVAVNAPESRKKGILWRPMRPVRQENTSSDGAAGARPATQADGSPGYRPAEYPGRAAGGPGRAAGPPGPGRAAGPPGPGRAAGGPQLETERGTEEAPSSWEGKRKPGGAQPGL